MLLSSCNDCQHREICRYKEEYEKVVRGITVNVPEPFTLVLNCKHYYSTTGYLNSHTYGDSNWAASKYTNIAEHGAAQLSSHYK